TVSLGAGTKDELHLVDAETTCYEGSPIKVKLAILKMSVQPVVSLGGFDITSRSKVPQKKVKLAAHKNGEDEDEDEDNDDNDFDEEEAKEKASVKKSTCNTPTKSAQKTNQNEKDSKPLALRSEGQDPSKNRKKLLKH
ncbi:hypothetical protein HPG69_004948, partial [Diceros bicornis minor]